MWVKGDEPSPLDTDAHTSVARWVVCKVHGHRARAPVNRAGLTMAFSLIDILTDPGRAQ
jgi:hypothetical protein